MTIHFYLNNEEETVIQSYHEMVSNPFKVGDIIQLSVDDLYPVDYNKFSRDRQVELIKDNNNLRDLFHLKSIKLVREGKYARFNQISDGKLTIEYHCEIVEE